MEPQSRGICHRGTGDAAEDHGRHDVHFAQTAAHRAQQLHAEVDDALGDTAGIHQLTGQHEQRHGDHQLAVSAVPHALRQHGDKVGCVDQNIAHAGSADCKGQRHAQRSKEDQQHQKDEHCHKFFSPFPYASSLVSALFLGAKKEMSALYRVMILITTQMAQMMPQTGMMPYIYIMGISIP